jgi:GDPmannose 4,6-dehydratase
MQAVHTLITGVGGQDGGYLAEQLAANKAPLLGLLAPGEAAPPHLVRLQSEGRIDLAACDLADHAAFRQLLRSTQPDRVFHLAAVSHPPTAARDPAASRAVNVTSLEVLLDWMRRDRHDVRLLTVSSAAVFGLPESHPQDEKTPARPVSEYGRQKQQVRELAAQARAADLFVACAIPFNHESPRRSEDYVFAKVCFGAARIARGMQQQLGIGNLRARRDWGYAPEYATAMSWMLEIERPTELVLATGEAHSVEELVAAAFARAGVEMGGSVSSDPTLVRGDDAPELVGCARRAWEELGWETTTSFSELVTLMVDSALEEPG